MSKVSVPVDASSALLSALEQLAAATAPRPIPYRHARSEHVRHVKEFSLPSRTKQEFKAEADINNIVRSYMATGQLDQSRAAYAKYVDLSALPESYHEALNLVQRVEDVFNSLPAESRDLYRNDPEAFLAAAQKDADSVFGVKATTPADTTPQAPQGPSEPQGGDIKSEPSS